MGNRDRITEQRRALALEFGVYTRWLADAIETLAPDDPLPAACRGTGNPALLSDLGDRLHLEPGSRLLDLGCGMGGPGEWLRRSHSLEVVGVDVMEEGVGAARSLFPSLVLSVASISSLPFRSATFAGGVAIGVLEMVIDKRAVLLELHRVLAAKARAVIFSHVRAAETLQDPPATDDFVTRGELEALISGAGFDVSVVERVDVVPSPPSDWRSLSRDVRECVRSAHEHDPRLSAVEEDLDRFNRLVRSRSIEPLLLVAGKA